MMYYEKEIHNGFLLWKFCPSLISVFRLRLEGLQNMQTNYFVTVSPSLIIMVFRNGVESFAFDGLPCVYNCDLVLGSHHLQNRHHLEIKICWLLLIDLIMKVLESHFSGLTTILPFSSCTLPSILDMKQIRTSGTTILLAARKIF